MYLRDGSAQTNLRAATLRQKLQIKRSTSPSHSILTPETERMRSIQTERQRQRRRDREAETGTVKQTGRREPEKRYGQNICVQP